MLVKQADPMHCKGCIDKENKKKFTPLMRTKWAWLKNDIMTRGSDITKNEEKARKNIVFFLSMTAQCVPIVAFPSLSPIPCPIRASGYRFITEYQSISAFSTYIYTFYDIDMMGSIIIQYSKMKMI